jgi:phospholipid transport system substrate-binding protein
MRMTALTRRASLLAAFAAFVGVAIPARFDTAPVASIQQLTDGLLQIMKAGPATPFQQRFEMLAPVIDRVFDLRPAFRRYTIASYVNSFDHFIGQRFTVER